MPFSFANLKTSSKILALSFCLNLLLLCVSAYGIYLLTSNQHLIQNMEKGITTQREALEDFKTSSADSLACLYGVILTAANESDTKKIAEIVKNCTTRVGDIKTLHDKLKNSIDSSGYPKESVELFHTRFASFIKSALGILDMVESDPVTAQVWMTGSKKKFDDFDDMLDKYDDYLVSQKKNVIDHLYSTMENGRTIFLLATMIIFGLGFFLSITIGRKIATPIKAMANVIEGLANKRYDGDIPALGQLDEVGQMAGAVMSLKDALASADRLASEQDVERRRKEERAHKLDKLTASFEQQVGRLVSVLASTSSELTSTATKMSDNANAAAGQAGDAAQRASQTSENVQAVATATEELSSSVSEISRQVHASTKAMDKAIEQVRHTDAVVNNLAEGAEKIGEIITLIDTIAGQTNLLALNATIEAARAGEAGKGFAVVASEVKNLANQTGRATQEIGAQINQMQTATNQAVQAIRVIGETIREVGGIQQSIAAAVEEQGSATNEITRNVQQASDGTRVASENIMLVEKAAVGTGQATTDVLQAAKELTNQSGELRSSVETFLSGVRTA